uniref:Cystatin-like protein n=1 Tax=Latrodectus hesperus TaxID=256737 RepID=E7D1Q9_LATHE|nr:cystatin-like protein [Latrodectus hesperus]
MGVSLKILICLSMLCLAASMMTGGWQKELNPNSESIQKYAKFATAKVSASSNSLHHLKLTRISNVEKQVVSGMNYKMTITMAPTECKKNGNSTQLNIDECPLLKCGAPNICNVTVWVQAWMENGIKLTKSSCTQGVSAC